MPNELQDILKRLTDLEKKSIQINLQPTEQENLKNNIFEGFSDLPTGASKTYFKVIWKGQPYYIPTGIGEVTDATLSMSDITTNDVSTSKHGFAPKAPNDTAKFLRGDASWATLPASGLTTSFDYQVFTSIGSNTWTKPAGATANSIVYVQLWGGGGGGGAANNVVTGGGGGGGGGEYIELKFRASDLNDTVPITIGDGGAGGTDVASVGGTGANSNFGGTNFLVARGGVGGKGSSNGDTGGGSGGGYFPGSGVTGAPGQDSRDGLSGGQGGQAGNNGGGSVKGGGGGAGGNGSTTGGASIYGGDGGDGHAGNSDGSAGGTPGGGGGGATRIVGTTLQNGGKGGRGECRVWTYL